MRLDRASQTGLELHISEEHQGGHATTRFLEGFLEGSRDPNSSNKCFLEGFLEGTCKGFQ